MMGFMVTLDWPSGHGVAPVAGGVCWRWVFRGWTLFRRGAPCVLPRSRTGGQSQGRDRLGNPTRLAFRIGRGSKPRIAAVSTGAGDGTVGEGGRQFTDARTMDR